MSWNFFSELFLAETLIRELTVYSHQLTLFPTSLLNITLFLFLYTFFLLGLNMVRVPCFVFVFFNALPSYNLTFVLKAGPIEDIKQQPRRPYINRIGLSFILVKWVYLAFCLLEACRCFHHQIEAICPRPPLHSLLCLRAAAAGPPEIKIQRRQGQRLFYFPNCEMLQSQQNISGRT